jgi:trehalose synthase
MPAIEHIDVPAMDPRRFESVLTPEDFQELLHLIENANEGLADRVVWNVNSTSKGGGVVELLWPLLGYSRGAGIDARWVVIHGNHHFFEITKRLHNHLHGFEGDGGPLGDAEHVGYQEVADAAAEELAPLVGPRDIVILHDPQTGGMTSAIKATGATTIWRCHIGLDRPNDRARGAWDFLRPYVLDADSYVFSRAAFAWEGLDKDKVTAIQPSIDVFSPKNVAQSPDQTRAILAAARIVDDAAAGEPRFTRGDGSEGTIQRQAELVEEARLAPDDRVVTQVSRWDRLKDPAGVLKGFVEHVAPDTDAHLLLVGPSVASVADDPEGAAVLQTITDDWAELPLDVRRRVHLASLPMDDVEENAAMVNAVQRHGEVVVQKSLAEGFGLTVAEAMWKERPVVASRIGGIQDQIVDGESGVLISDPWNLEEFGRGVVGLLSEPERAREMGCAAQTRVRRNFLGPHHLGRYYALIESLIGERTELEQAS